MAVDPVWVFWGVVNVTLCALFFRLVRRGRW
jgi:hypothetical protein